jgi:hypothetical protein
MSCLQSPKVRWISIALLTVSTTFAGTIDAVAGASVRILGGTTSNRSAHLLFRESHSNYNMWCFWDTKPVTTNSANKKAVDKRGSSGYVDITGLAPRTTYNVLLHGEGHGVSLSDNKYMSIGRFTTDATASVQSAVSLQFALHVQVVSGIGFRIHSATGALAWRLLRADGTPVATGIATEAPSLVRSNAKGQMILEYDGRPSIAFMVF